MYDWNRTQPDPWASRRPRVVDETLRDGLQSPSSTDPPLSRKIDMLHAMADVGVEIASVGLPAAGSRALAHAAALAKEIATAKLPITPTAAGRTTEGDVRAIADASERSGVPIAVYAFIGSSPIRAFVEGWDVALLRKRIRVAAETARSAGLPFCLVTEDTTRTPPDVVRALFAEAVEGGASRVCVCDTVGHADPWGVQAMIGYVKKLLAELGAEHVAVDWHGHNDRGLALGNALVAGLSGADAVHGTARGFGERCGNTPIELLVMHLAAAGARPAPTPEALARYVELAGPDYGVVTDSVTTVKLVLNGDPVEIATRPSRTLLELLRYDLDLVGTKQGCDKGDCGACTVLIDGKPALACLTLALACNGHHVTTVESLRRDDPLLDAFDRHGAGQCGFCTAGMLMVGKALLGEREAPSRDRIRLAISGNLCRCTGYGSIVDAVEDASRGKGDVGMLRPGEEHPSPPLPCHERSKP